MRARLLPMATNSESWVWRTLTMANSAATKKPLAMTNRNESARYQSVMDDGSVKDFSGERPMPRRRWTDGGASARHSDARLGDWPEQTSGSYDWAGRRLGPSVANSRTDR